MHQVLGHFTFAGAALTPNHWVARGLQAAARGDLGRSLWVPRPWSGATACSRYLLAAFAAPHGSTGAASTAWPPAARCGGATAAAGWTPC